MPGAVQRARSGGDPVKKWLRPLGISLGFYAAACALVLRLIPGEMAGAAVAGSSGDQRVSSFVSAPASASSASAVQPAKTVSAPTSAAFDIVDISHHDTINDWAALRSAANGLYMKATEGTSFVDPMLASYTSSAEKAGMPVGFFHYFWPTANSADAVKQANHFYQVIHAYAYTFYPALDVEEDNGLTPAALTASVKAFAAEFKRLSGQDLLIYCSRKFADTYLTDASLTQYGLWVADYNGPRPTRAGAWKTFVMWQYTDSASVSGVPHPMDADHATAAIILPGK